MQRTFLFPRQTTTVHIDPYPRERDNINDLQVKRCLEFGVDILLRMTFLYGLMLNVATTCSEDIKACWYDLWLVRMLTTSFYMVTICLHLLSVFCIMGDCTYKEYKVSLFMLDAFLVPMLAIYGIIVMIQAIPKECLVTNERTRDVIYW